MAEYINGLLQEVLESGKDYNELAELIESTIMKNDDDMYEYIIDRIQLLINQKAERWMEYDECENMYLTIKGFESIL